MRLSEAIRLGAMLKPQAFGGLTLGGGTCALGAAYEAAGILCNYIADPETVRVTFPITTLVYQRCPHCEWCDCDDFLDAIAHLNDDHRWTREQIADWVETIEQQQEQATAPVAETVSA